MSCTWEAGLIFRKMLFWQLNARCNLKMHSEKNPLTNNISENFNRAYT